MSNELDDLFKEHGKKLRIFVAYTNTLDPYEQNKEVNYLNSLPIKALIKDLTGTQMSWKTSGVIEEQGKEILMRKKHKNLMKQSHKIEIDGDTYLGWKDNSNKTVIKEEGSYIKLYLYRKND